MAWEMEAESFCSPTSAVDTNTLIVMPLSRALSVLVGSTEFGDDVYAASGIRALEPKEETRAIFGAIAILESRA